MIAHLNGTLIDKTLSSTIIDVHGVGYLVRMPLSDLSSLPAKHERVSLHIHTHLRENALELFGFLELASLRAFECLIQVSGIGPKTALAVLSTLKADELAQAVHNADVHALTRVPGIGQKTAQKALLDLKDRMKIRVEDILGSLDADKHVIEDLRSAIGNLGYKPAAIDSAVSKLKPLLKSGKNLSELVKEALKHL